MDEVETALEKQKVKGRRMVIEEVSDEDDSDGEEQRPEVERSSPEVETKSPEAEIKPEVVREQPKVEVETKLLNESESGSSVVDEASSVTSPASLHRKAASAGKSIICISDENRFQYTIQIKAYKPFTTQKEFIKSVLD